MWCVEGSLGYDIDFRCPSHSCGEVYFLPTKLSWPAALFSRSHSKSCCSTDTLIWLLYNMFCFGLPWRNVCNSSRFKLLPLDYVLDLAVEILGVASSSPVTGPNSKSYKNYRLKLFWFQGYIKPLLIWIYTESEIFLRGSVAHTPMWGALSTGAKKKELSPALGVSFNHIFRWHCLPCLLIYSHSKSQITIFMAMIIAMNLYVPNIILQNQVKMLSNLTLAIGCTWWA